ncbi:M24 family metallopeptidase [Sinorhizobium medicae]|uniref:M24 family metallopeptidase n=1 Tax=Sinorhizobium medicae TaxID=110321 RepID=UPI0004869073|nr:Xaa-Pro peptidase family protein [Sinorhizobium medicae]
MFLAFAKQEFLSRNEAACRKIAAGDVDVALVFSASNQYYLTGYSAGSSYTPQVLIVPADGSQPTLITRTMDALTATLTAYLDDAHVVALPESFIGVSDKDGFDFICSHVSSMGYSSMRIGVELSTGYLGATTWEKMKRLLPNAKFSDITGVITQLRTVKSPAEMVYMRQAAAISDLAMAAAVDAVGPGVRECDAAAAIVAALARGTDEFGGSQVCNPAMPAGIRQKAPHLYWTDSPYKAGAGVNIELAGNRFKYVSPLSRTISVGEPSKALGNLHATVLEAMGCAVEQMKPGNLCATVSDAFQKVIVPRGYTKTSRIGYSIGIDWMEGTASLQKSDTTELVPNMTFHMICGMWEEKDVSCVLSESFLITEQGAESLSKMPRKMFVKN